SGPVPVSTTISGGATAYFTWVYSPTGTGTLYFTSSAAGFDANNGNYVFMPYSVTSNVVSVQPNRPVLASWLRVVPQVISENQRYTVVMSVSNVGIVDAPNTVPDGIIPVLGSSLISGANPPAADIAVGGYREFSWVFRSSTTAGTAAVTSLARSQGWASDEITSNNTNLLNVRSNPAITQQIFLYPAVVSVDQLITAVMRVTNSGGSGLEAAAANPLARVGAGNAALVNGPIPASQAIPASGGVVEYTWTYRASQPGLLAYNGNVTGYNEYSKVTITSIPASTSNDITVEQKAALSAVISIPASVNVGQPFNVTMTVTNISGAGGAVAENVQPSAPLIGGDGGAIFTGTLPAAQDIPGGASREFVWEYQASGSGTVYFNCQAQGTDENTLLVVSTGNVTSNNMSVQVPAGLAISVSAQPGVIGAGNNITVRVSVTNTGTATANNLSVIYLDDTQVVAPGNATLSSGSVPTSAINLAGGASAYYTWIYTASSPGTVRFDARVTAEDANDRTALDTGLVSSPNVAIMPAAVLAASVNLYPPVASTGQAVTMVMTVSNSGGELAYDVAAGGITSAGSTGSLSPVSGPVSNTTTVSAAGEEHFTWIYTASSPGYVYVSATATGRDGSLHNTVSAAAAGSGVITVESASMLVSSLYLSHAQASVGQEITLTMQVTNNGQADALNVLPSVPVVSGTGSVTAVATPAAQNIAGGAAAAFEWRYTASLPGTVQFTSRAEGTDENSLSSVNSGVASSPALLIQSAASLSAYMQASPAAIPVGGVITVVMTVSNLGQAQASSVTPALLSQEGTAAAGAISGPSAASYDMPGLSTAYFTWTFTAAGTGTVFFTVSAQGADSNSGLAVATAGNVTSNAVSVSPNYPVMASWIDVSPQALSINQRYTVIMTVSNTGIVNAPLADPDEPSMPLGGTAVLNPVPPAADIPAGGTYRFTWVYQTGTTTGTGAVTSRARSSGEISSDVTSGGTNVITVYGQPILSQSSLLSPATVSVGQWFTIVMSVSNNAGADTQADGVKPNAFVKLGTGDYAAISGPVPVSQNVAPGESRDFIWTYSAAAAGTLGINANVTAYNYYSKATMTSASTSSNTITVVNPAALSSSIFAPSTVNFGDDFEIVMSVTNTGGATAENVIPSALSIAGSGGAIPVSLPVAQDIAAGTHRAFTFTYNAAGTGNVVFNGNASGADQYSQAVVSSAATNSGTVVINKPASLNMAMNIVNGSQAGTGEYITVVLSVTNTGDTAAVNVTPSVAVDGTAVNWINGALAAGIPSLAGGASRHFTWTYQGTVTGNITFSATLSANDGLSGNPVISVPAIAERSIDIVPAAAINITSMTALPGQVSIGQEITVEMVVANGGTGQAVNVVPSALQKFGSASGDYVSGPSPAIAASIASGASFTFTWVYTATSAGNMWFSVSASGFDPSRGIPINAPVNGSGEVVVQAPASLMSSLSLVPQQASVGQAITVIMSVTNNGGAAAVS
ncbi:MAG TPA: CARDB domain-containing protein, partial [Candidatus Goldiibacteriota bacterium]|nr:CARDB domain-containing protein [Candidatus Goldiibacteriota bacterium]